MCFAGHGSTRNDAERRRTTRNNGKRRRRTRRCSMRNRAEERERSDASSPMDGGRTSWRNVAALEGKGVRNVAPSPVGRSITSRRVLLRLLFLPFRPLFLFHPRLSFLFSFLIPPLPPLPLSKNIRRESSGESVRPKPS